MRPLHGGAWRPATTIELDGAIESGDYGQDGDSTQDGVPREIGLDEPWDFAAVRLRLRLWA